MEIYDRTRYKSEREEKILYQMKKEMNEFPDAKDLVEERYDFPLDKFKTMDERVRNETHIINYFKLGFQAGFAHAQVLREEKDEGF